MIVKTFDEILTYLNDKLDEFIAPKSDGVKILRTNNNILYLLQKADSKGYELIQASCVALDAKFDPARCSDADLVSVGKIAGTNRLPGKPTVLMITATNTNTVATSIITGLEYPAKCVYQYSADVWFEFTVPSMQTFEPNESRTYFAYSVSPETRESLIGAYEITAQDNIAVMTDTDGDYISSGFLFSCASTEGTLGYPEETPLEFRKRILSDTDREDTLRELETEINALPTILSCRVVFNRDSSEDLPVGPVDVPPFYLLVVVSGEVTEELGQAVLRHGIFPTVDVEGQVADEYRGELIMTSDNYTDGYVPVYYMRFIPYQYMIEITYASDPALALDDTIQSTIVNKMASLYGNPTRHTAEITEDMFYNDVASLNIDSLKVLNVTLDEYESGSWGEAAGGYIAVPASELAKMCGIVFWYKNSSGGDETKTYYFSITKPPVLTVEGLDVTMTSDEADAEIRYTTDGSIPTRTSGTVYTGPVTVTADTTVTAVAYTPYKETSAPAEVKVE